MVIIGGGIVGVSAAFHLAEAGAKVAAVRARPARLGLDVEGCCGVRAQFSDPLNIRIAERSLECFKDFARRPGWQIDLHEVGYLFLLTREAEVEAFTRNVALQNELGVPSRIVTRQEARELSPLLEVDDVLAASYSPRAMGTPRPSPSCMGYAFAARQLGAKLLTGHEVEAIERADGRITAVHANRQSDHGQLPHPRRRWCCGSATRELGLVTLPVSPLRRQVLLDRADAGLPKRIADDRLQLDLLLPRRRPRPAVLACRTRPRPPASTWR